MKRTYLIFIALTAFALSGQTQGVSKKEAVARKIKSVAEWETDLRERRPTDILETYVVYNKEGEVVEIQERDNSGEITLHEKYEYDADGNKITEYQYNANGTLNKKHVYTYVNELRTERLTYDAKDRLIGKKKYIYEFYEK